MSRSRFRFPDWVTSLEPTDHAVVHLSLSVLALMLGMAYGLLGRINALSAGDGPDLLRAHGIVLLFLCVVPVLPAVVGNIALPRILGVPRMALPRLGRVAVYLHALAFALLLVAMCTDGLRPGWLYFAAYAPEIGADQGVLWLGAALVTSALSGALGGLSTLVTIGTARQGRRDPLVSGMAVACVAQLLTMPSILAAVVLVAIDRKVGVGVLDPRHGGDALLLPRLVSFFVQPALTGVLAASIGVVDHLLSVNSDQEPRSSRLFVIALVVLVGARMVASAIDPGVSGEGEYVSENHVLLSRACLVLSASAAPLFAARWLSILRSGHAKLTAPLLYALSFVLVFALSSPAALLLALPAIGDHLRSSSFFTGEIHLVAFGSVLALVGALYHFWSALSGRRYEQKIALSALGTTTVGLLLAFIPMLVMGLQGTPRPMSLLPSAGTVFVALGGGVSFVGVLLTLATFLHSLVRGKKLSETA